jgi:lipoprotein-anchoring transpeptidase ErfK/SrfK
VRITHGYLVAYEGDVPVYATAVSPGIDGIDPRRHASPTGSYRVYVKAVSWDMADVDKSKEWMVAEVPWVGFYLDSYAVHGAWWHDDFGRPKSHGCINLPPADAREIFAWMDPPLPEGWYAVGAYYPHVPGTVVQLTP